MQYMKSVAMELEPSAIVRPDGAQSGLREKFASYLELTKPRITFLIVLTAAAGFFLGAPGTVNYLMFFHAMYGIALLSSGLATLNQYMERELDGLMRRTASRPLPSGRLAPLEAFLLGIALVVGAEIYLAFLVNPLTALFGVSVIVGYLLLYTPLKTRTTLSTVVGAIPGAMPPLMGWTAATGKVGAGGLVLFAILFLWQFPHFLAIAWMYREDYGRAGIVMLPVVEPEGRVTGQQIVVYTLLLVPVSLLPTVLGMSGLVYLYGAVALGLLFLFFSLRAAFSRSRQEARRLLLASVIYLPLLFVLMVIDR